MFQSSIVDEKTIKKKPAYTKYQKYRLKSDLGSRKWLATHPHRAWARLSLWHHRTRGCQIKLSTDDLERLAKQVTNCFICGISLDYRLGKGRKYISSDSSPSLDLRNPEIRVVEFSNVDIICHPCNMAKGKRTLDEFVKYCATVVNRLGNQ